LAEVVELVEPGMLNTAQVEGAFGAFSSILAAAESRRSERAKVGRYPTPSFWLHPCSSWHLYFSLHLYS
jgi:hypothetical protein